MLNKNNFKSIEKVVPEGDSRINSRLNEEDGNFDRYAAEDSFLDMENSKISLNPLFLNTNLFNIDTKDYARFRSFKKQELQNAKSNRLSKKSGGLSVKLPSEIMQSKSQVQSQGSNFNYT